MPRTIALIVAAGRGHRLGGAVPKQYRMLGGKALLRHAAERLLAHPGVDGVRVVFHPDDMPLYAQAMAGIDLPPPVPGGATRQDSVRLGLEAMAPGAPDLVLIHDAARPFLPSSTVDAVLDALRRHAGAVPGLPVADTLKRGRDGLVGGTVDRDGLWRAQTPQGFRFADILAAHRSAAGLALTDDAAVAERAGLSVALVPGSEENFKVTTEEDLMRAGRLAAPLSGAAWESRTGMGFDVHRFGPGDHVWLCGVKVPHDHGLIGHSDADVGLHALTDAVLGALSEGDIGKHFPPTDPQWRGAPSDLFLRHAGGLVAARGGRLVHADITLICERPKIGPHREAMATRMAEILSVDPSRISVKATTTEQLGFTGRQEGMAAQAVATVALPGS